MKPDVSNDPPTAAERAAVRHRNAELRQHADAVTRRSLRLRLEAMLLCQQLAMHQLDREVEAHLREVSS